MQALESVRRNYLYHDWEELCASIRLAGGIPAMPHRGEEVDRARRRWASLLSQGALFKRMGWINWRVPPDPLRFPAMKLLELGQWVDRFLQGVDRGIGSGRLIQGALGFPACPEERALWKHQREEPLHYFRLDMTQDHQGHLKLIEIQVVMGGLGIAQALREAYGPHPGLPGVAGPYEEAILAGFRRWCSTRELDPAPHPLIAVLGARHSAYRHEHLVLSRHLKRSEMAIAPLALLERGPSGRLSLPDGRVPQIIHRLFRSPSLFKNSPERGLALLEAMRDGQTYLVNPWKDWLEDKRILALVHDPDAPRALPGCLTADQWRRLRELVPMTWLATRERTAELLDRPRSKRGVYLKKGRSFESRQLWDGQQVSLRQWNAACLRAREEGDWVIQEAVRGQPHPFRYLDFQAQEIREMVGYVRISPLYFRCLDGGIRLADVLVTAREERSRVHGASDAVLGVPGVALDEPPPVDGNRGPMG